MSTIIDLLKNSISQKTSDYIGVPSIPLTQNEESFLLQRYKHYIIFVFLFFVLLLTAYFKISKVKNTDTGIHSSSTVQLNTPDTHQMANTDIVETTSSEVNITNITIKQNKKSSKLLITFNHPVLYRLTSHQSENRYTLAFDNTQVANAITINNAHQAGINDIHAEVKNQTLIFNLALAQNTLLKSIHPIKVKQGYQLSINLAKVYPAKQLPNSSHVISTVKRSVRKNTIYEQYISALGEAKSGNTNSAINKLKTLIHSKPAFIDSHISLAALLINNGDFSKANNIVDNALKLQPRNTALIELKARLYLQKGKPQRALQLLDSNSPDINSNTNYYALKAAVYEKQNSNQLAVALYKKLLKQDGFNGKWWFGLAVSLDKLGESTDAVYAYRQALNNGHLSTDSLVFLQNRLNDLSESGHGAS